VEGGHFNTPPPFTKIGFFLEPLYQNQAFLPPLFHYFVPFCPLYLYSADFTVSSILPPCIVFYRFYPHANFTSLYHFFSNFLLPLCCYPLYFFQPDFTPCTIFARPHVFILRPPAFIFRPPCIYLETPLYQNGDFSDPLFQNGHFILLPTF